ncbi:MAG: hypothetical protein WA962_13965, partial [Ornithinimicrobium sp.]
AAELMARELSERFAGTSRGVQISVAQPEHFAGDSDAAYGNRDFLRHYCAHLAGPDPASQWSAFPADVRAARGFNGDIGHVLDDWRAIVRRRGEDGQTAGMVGRRVARKSLLALAGLVSVTDGTWTTDRGTAAT